MIQRATARSVWGRCNTLLRYISKDSTEDSKRRKLRSIRTHRENKKLFGSLLETLPEKRKREDNCTSSKNVSIVHEDNDKSSEMHWVENNCASRTIRIKFKNHKTTHAPIPYKKFNNEKKDYLKSNVQTVQDVLKVPVHTNLHNQFHSGITLAEDISLVSPKIIDNTNPIELVNEQSSDSAHVQLLPPVILRNLMTFPLKNNKRITAQQNSSESNVISLPLDYETKKKFKNYPSVTKILSSTMSEKSLAALEKWKNDLIKKLGEEGFKIYHERLLAQGSLFHATIRNFLTSSEISTDIEPEIEGCWHSLQPVLEHVSGVEVLESHVVHSLLMYHGIIDCVAFYRGKPYLIEWKKSDKQKPHLSSTYEAPLQVAAYLGALNYDNNYKMKVQGGMVVVAYTDGSPAHVHQMNSSECSKYWKYWLERLQLYWVQTQKGTIAHQNILSRSTA